MKVIFLDFDGVLNSMAWERRRYKSLADSKNSRVDPASVGLLNQLIDRTGAVIVVSSSWRIAGLGAVNHTLAVRGCIGTVIGRTPVLNDYRGAEIQAWLDQQREDSYIESFVILDDADDMDPFLDRLVLTRGLVGLSQHDVDKAVAVLGRPYVAGGRA